MRVGNYFSISGKWVGSPKNGPVSMPLKSHWHWSMCMDWILFIGELCVCASFVRAFIVLGVSVVRVFFMSYVDCIHSAVVGTGGLNYLLACLIQITLS